MVFCDLLMYVKKLSSRIIKIVKTSEMLHNMHKIDATNTQFCLLLSKTFCAVRKDLEVSFLRNSTF